MCMRKKGRNLRRRLNKEGRVHSASSTWVLISIVKHLREPTQMLIFIVQVRLLMQDDFAFPHQCESVGVKNIVRKKIRDYSPFPSQVKLLK